MFGKQQHGLTAIEILAVTAILGILATMTTPHLARWRSTLQINAVARAIASELQLARMNAINQNTPFRLSFNTINHTYQRQKHEGGTWQNDDDVIPLPSKVNLVSVSADPVFQTLGNASGGATIVVQHTQGRSRTIHVSATGHVKVE